MYIVYENYNNPHATIHKSACRHINKHGGEHPNSNPNNGYSEHTSLEDAQAYASKTGLKHGFCKTCLKQVIPRNWG